MLNSIILSFWYSVEFQNNDKFYAQIKTYENVEVGKSFKN